MPDLDKMDRTWLCSVLFMDIAAYSSQSVEIQIRLKERFNKYLSEALLDVPESERVILDTGDGAAICFLGAPEAAMFTALKLWRSFVEDCQKESLGLHVRLGVNLGPVKLVKDINGALNAIGDGMNAGQRIMSFASENQILVSQSYYEVVSRLSDDYKALFRLKGVETDKHIREHTVYHLLPPGAPAAPPPRRTRSRRSPALTAAGLLGAAALAVAGASFWYFRQPQAAAISMPPIAQGTPIARPAAAMVSPAVATAPAPAPKAPPKVSSIKSAPLEATGAEDKPPVERTPPPAAAVDEYNEGKRLIENQDPANAIAHFDKALAVDSIYVEALLGRAQARRLLQQYDRSLEDCDRALKISKNEPAGYMCRGFADHLATHNDVAVKDFTEAIRLNPAFALAYNERGVAYADLEKYDDAVRDYSMAIRLRPRNADFRMRRATANAKLGHYDKSIQDFTEVIRLEPNNIRAYRGRAAAEEATGDVTAASADRAHVREARGR
ncbi:MAG TPA: tetratricopeptide repeat protein [Bryobacteraceae bacterium]|nr:tetratricopeptide repeat protein [Bryobacteraceae bacterium]